MGRSAPAALEDPGHHARTDAETPPNRLPLGYVGFNGAIGTAHVLRHDEGADELDPFLEQIRLLVERPGIRTIRMSGHAGCSSPALAAGLEELCERARARGIVLEVLPGVCQTAAE